MRRFWIGAVVLVVLLAAGAGMTAVMDRIHSSISADMSDAAAMALTEDWASADALAGRAKQTWEQRHKFVAAFVDHDLMEAADSLFAELSVYRTRMLSSDYAAVCLCLARQAEAIGESHSLRWWHLL